MGAVASSSLLAGPTCTWALSTCLALALCYVLAKLPTFISRVRVWNYYCSSHTSWYNDAGAGKFNYLEDPYSRPRVYWLARHPAAKRAFSSAATADIDHRSGFDWFHYAGWEIPTTHPKYRDVVRKADQSVHVNLMKSKLGPLLASVEEYALEEFARFNDAIGKEGKVVSLHSLMYRLAYNVNCKSLFGKELDHVATRIVLQRFSYWVNDLINTFNWPLPFWISKRIVPGARKAVRARDDMYDILVKWDKSGGSAKSSSEMQAIIEVFEHGNTPAEIRSTFTNMMMAAFLANTPEALGWLFTNLLQAPVLFAKVKAECDALPAGSLINFDFKTETPYFYSALFETFRMWVFTGTSAIIKKPTKLPGMGDKVFQPGDNIRQMGQAIGRSTDIYGPDAMLWKGHRFVGEGAELLQYDMTFGIGRSPCPGRAFAIAELSMLATRMIKQYDFSDLHISQHLPFESDDFEVLGPAEAQYLEIIDLDESHKTIIYPGNWSNTGPPGMTSSNIPLHDFACKLSIRSE